jgi:hypothetical protein
MLLTKYIAFSTFVVGFASLVIEKVTDGHALWWPFVVLSGSVLFMLFIYHFFIYCACNAAERFNLIEKKND